MVDYIKYAEKRYAQVSDLLGLTLSEVVREGDESLNFKSREGREFVMYHEQDCCESVNIEDLCGDLSDLLGSPVLIAEESVSDKRPEGMDAPGDYDDSETWTFYRIGTAKGLVTIRWYGSSNGYYSESVDFIEKVKSEGA